MEELRLRMLDSRALRKIFGPREGGSTKGLEKIS
jgi:hypothetical protein